VLQTTGSFAIKVGGKNRTFLEINPKHHAYEPLKLRGKEEMSLGRSADQQRRLEKGNGRGHQGAIKTSARFISVELIWGNGSQTFIGGKELRKSRPEHGPRKIKKMSLKRSDRNQGN